MEPQAVDTNLIFSSACHPFRRHNKRNLSLITFDVRLSCEADYSPTTMVKTLVESLAEFLSSFVGFLPPGLGLCVAAAYLGEGKFFEPFRQEFVGTLLMIAFTFSAGKWVGEDSLHIAWASHAVGVIAADYFGGGPHVNPAVTMAMFSMGKCSYTEGFVRVAAQLGGGLIAFPLYHAIAEQFKMTPFGGPEFNLDDKDEVVEAFLSEFMATVLLMWAIYLLNWELHFGSYHYIIKQTLTAVAIRALIEFFPTAGPAMNPVSRQCRRSTVSDVPFWLVTLLSFLDHVPLFLQSFSFLHVYRCLLRPGPSLAWGRYLRTPTTLCITLSTGFHPLWRPFSRAFCTSSTLVAPCLVDVCPLALSKRPAKRSRPTNCKR